MARGDKTLNITSNVLIFGGLIFVFFAMKSCVKSKILLADGDRIEGEVVRIIEDYDDEGMIYWPVFQYKDKKNNETLYKSEVGTGGESEYALGEKVVMVYDRNEGKVKVLSFWGLYNWVMVFLILSFFCLVPGLSMRWIAKPI